MLSFKHFPVSVVCSCCDSNTVLSHNYAITSKHQQIDVFQLSFGHFDNVMTAYSVSIYVYEPRFGCNGVFNGNKWPYIRPTEQNRCDTSHNDSMSLLPYIIHTISVWRVRASRSSSRGAL